MMIIEFTNNCVLENSHLMWFIHYKEENELIFKKISVDYHTLKLLLEHFGYETNDIDELKKFGVSIKNIKYNSNLRFNYKY
jgi:hypothetical protein